MQHVILVTKPYIGSDDELGRKLYVNFWRTLAESIQTPKTICFLHESVKSLLANSVVIVALQVLAKDGVELLACRTCCEYYGISEQLACGKIVTMGDIQAELLVHSALSL